ncbi:MAG: alpha-ketoglutaric semialdehyde dehydrogenase [Candidatus Latescibacterota bacterium]|jgi:alpha-ketoglutaric semialdehyde dehydrogenase
MITDKNYIGYKLSAQGDTSFKTFNPQTNTENSQVLFEATETEIDEACTLASEAFKNYRKTPGIKRAAFLNAIAEEILALGDLLLDTYVMESGLPKGRAEGERGRTMGQLRMFADLISKEDWREPSVQSDGEKTRKMLIPIGPVAVFGASNFPLAYSTAGGDTASALAAGNPVIVKGHPMHAQTGQLVAGAIINAAHKTGMPEGVFSSLNSKDIEVGALLVKHPKIKAVGFTGSIRGGRALYNLAASRKEPIPVFAEMGSINPVIITQKALETRSAEIANNYADSITLGAGQFCTNPGLILAIQSKETREFIETLGLKLAKKSSFCMLHPNIQKGYGANKEDVIGQHAVEVVSKTEDSGKANYAQAALVTVAGDVFLENEKLHQEVFGPFSMVVQCKDKAQLIEIIEKLEGQLTGTIMAEKSDYANLVDVFEALQERVGRVVFNGVPTGVEVCAAMTHGGPYPASTDSRFTAVGEGAIRRWVRPFTFQDVPDIFLPEILK